MCARYTMLAAAFGAAVSLAPASALAQAAGADRLAATASEWGGQGGVYTCQQWKAYAARMYRVADVRHRGFFNAADFERLKAASPVFAEASFDFFDQAGKGKVTQKEFLEAENPFFVYFDRQKTCRVTTEDLRNASAPKAAQQQNSQRNSRGNVGDGLGPGSFGWRGQ